MDESGLILACSDERKIGQNFLQVEMVIHSKDRVVLHDGYSYQKIYIKNKLELIVFINSVDEKDLKVLSLISLNISNMKLFYEDKYDKNTFMKNIILDNILPGDIPLRSKELHLLNNVCRVAALIKTDKSKDIYVHDVIQGLFPNKAKDFIIILDEENTVLIKELKTKDDYKEIERTASNILDTLTTEVMIKATIGIGTIVDNIRDIGRSFKEAQMALLVGGIFENDKSVINYNNLGIGRLIYQLPTTLCDLFLKEVFKEDSLEALDHETVYTIQKFFENNLNVSETARQLYVHRNTLVYRLDKIQKMTGLDIRMFDSAIIFKVAMLVKRYLEKTEKMI
jgi:carbohydrate diacid regulator